MKIFIGSGFAVAYALFFMMMVPATSFRSPWVMVFLVAIVGFHHGFSFATASGVEK